MVYVQFIREDGWGEHGSVAAWVVASLFFALAAWRSSGRQRLVYVGIAGLAFFMGMEEISWGQRLLGFQSPEFFAERNLQKEATVHNLIDIHLIYRPAAAGLVLWSVGLWLLARTSVRADALFKKWSVPLVPSVLWPFFLASALCFGLKSNHELFEIGEILLALGFCGLGLHEFLTSGPGAMRTRKPLLAVISLGLLLGGITYALVRLSPEPTGGEMRTRLDEMAFRTLMAGRPIDAVRLFEASEQIQELDRSEKAFFFGLALHTSGRTERAQQVLVGYLEGQIDPNKDRVQQIDTLGDARQARLLGLSACVLGRSGLAGTLFERGERIDRNHLTSSDGPALEALTRGSLATTLMLQGRRTDSRRERSRALALAPTSDLKRSIRIGVRQSRRLRRLSGCTTFPG